MTQIVTFADNDQRIKFYSHSINDSSRNLVAKRKISAKTLLLRWFDNSSLLQPVRFSADPVNRNLPTDSTIIKFELSNDYREYFVLLRGLLEFSRPKEIMISVNSSEKTFEVYVSASQHEAVIAYLEIILEFFLKEINFKKLLKSVLQFEHTLKQRQAVLYSSLKASLQ